MPTIARTREICDEFVAAEVAATMASRQQNYSLLRGRYWQTGATHSTPPAHTGGSLGSAIPDRLDLSPSDAFDNWRVAFPLWATLPMPCSLRVDVYDGPQGKGWVLVAEFLHNGARWRRATNVGPESNRTYDWTLQPPPPADSAGR